MFSSTVRLFVEVVALLAEVAGLDALWPSLTSPRVGLFGPGEQAHERGLADAVRADERHALAPLDQQLAAPDDVVVAVGLFRTFVRARGRPGRTARPPAAAAS